MRRRTVGLLAALALLAAAPAASVEAQPANAPQVVAAKSCSSGFKHAVMPDGSHKCLHSGEFCKRKSSWQHVYHKHGFHCGTDHRLHKT